MSAEPHDHDEPGGHAHGVNPNADRRWLTIALSLILAFMAAEVTIGVIARSLALISDAAHMLTDAASLILALVAIRLAARPAKGTYTYGLKRAEILSAQANGLSLLLLGAWLAYEAIKRLLSPPDVAGGLVLATALAGIVVNIAAAWSLSRANRTSLNVEGAFQHILNDLYAFIATAISRRGHSGHRLRPRRRHRLPDRRRPDGQGRTRTAARLRTDPARSRTRRP
jgi:cobalt-zinc-cadmium efflux system protein